MTTAPISSRVFANRRKTIGFLVESFGNEYQQSVWQGAASAAREHGLNIVCFTGGSLRRSPQDPWEFQRNAIYDMAEHTRLDGVVASASLGNFVTSSEFGAFLHRFESIPLVTLIPTDFPEVRSVGVNNRDGMRRLVRHCIEHHGYRRFAYIAGPSTNKDAVQRLEALVEELRAHGLDLPSKNLFIGDWTRHCGLEAARELLDNRLPCDVVMCSNDSPALGVLEHFRAHRVRVPEDVAVVGFDDIEEARYVNPPLTTVNQPSVELGHAAVVKLVQLMDGTRLEPSSILSTRLVVRRTCGCLDAALGAVPKPGAAQQPPIAELQTSLLGTIVEAITKRRGEKPDEANLEHARALAEALARRATGLDDADPTHIAEDFADRAGGLTLERWVAALDAVRQTSWALVRDPAGVTLAGLCQTVLRGLIDRRRRDEGFHRIAAARQNRQLRYTGDVLTNVLDIPQLLDAVAKLLPQLGISQCCLALYDEPSAGRGRSRLLLESTDGARNRTGAEGTVLDTNLIAPNGAVADADPVAMIVEPLFFQSELFGYGLFKTSDGPLVEILRQYICSALHSSLLVKKVREQADALSLANTELQRLRSQERAYIAAIDRELELGRKIQSGLLPTAPPQPPGWNLALAFRPAQQVSGDFYDALQLDDTTVSLMIADISGKGVGAAVFMSLVNTFMRSTVQRYSEQGGDPLEAVAAANRYLAAYHRNPPGRVMFATLFLGLLNTQTGVLRYVNAGHNPPLIVRGHNDFSRLGRTGPAIGIATDSAYERGQVVVEHGQLFFAYTDGVTDAHDPAGKDFSLERLTALVCWPSLNAEQAVQATLRAVEAHTAGGEPYDDITMLAVKRL